MKEKERGVCRQFWSHHNFQSFQIPRDSQKALLKVLFIAQEVLAKNSSCCHFKFITSSFPIANVGNFGRRLTTDQSVDCLLIIVWLSIALPIVYQGPWCTPRRSSSFSFTMGCQLICWSIYWSSINLLPKTIAARSASNQFADC